LSEPEVQAGHVAESSKDESVVRRGWAGELERKRVDDVTGLC